MNTPPRPWDIFCRVIDNYGDIGVCWRLAADLASRGVPVRLWVDDPAPLAWMAVAGGLGHPAAAASVQVQRWDEHTVWPEPGAVVIEAFGCDPPETFVAAMDQQRAAGQPPLWLNLEYLSAEAYVERCHLLPSPQWRAPAHGLMKWFYYPGFTPATGGLLREPGSLERLDAPTHWAELGFQPRPGERVVSLFCYAGAPLASLAQALPEPEQPALWLLTPGRATEAWRATWGATSTKLPSHWRVAELPWLSQPAFDRLLAACDLNFVRGEDSFVRAQWAGKPFVWHIYPQEDGVHADKLEAFLNRHLTGAPDELAEAVRAWTRHWNGLAPPPALPLPPLADWRAWSHRWRQSLAVQPDLVTQLLGWVTARS